MDIIQPENGSDETLAKGEKVLPTTESKVNLPTFLLTSDQKLKNNNYSFTSVLQAKPLQSY